MYAVCVQAQSVDAVVEQLQNGLSEEELWGVCRQCLSTLNTATDLRKLSYVIALTGTGVPLCKEPSQERPPLNKDLFFWHQHLLYTKTSPS